jgi:hypothetical protein
MRSEALLALWELENMPACEAGMKLAKTFLETCGEAVNRLGFEEPGDRITEITTAYTTLTDHSMECDDCNEV